MSRTRFVIVWRLAALTQPCVTAARSHADEPAAIHSIDELWAGFDPRALPLDVEVVKAWDEGDVHLETIYFTGEVFEGEKTRIFGYFGRPRQPRARCRASCTFTAAGRRRTSTGRGSGPSAATPA